MQVLPVPADQNNQGACLSGADANQYCCRNIIKMILQAYNPDMST